MNTFWLFYRQQVEDSGLLSKSSGPSYETTCQVLLRARTATEAVREADVRWAELSRTVIDGYPCFPVVYLVPFTPDPFLEALRGDYPSASVDVAGEGTYHFDAKLPVLEIKLHTVRLPEAPMQKLVGVWPVDPEPEVVHIHGPDVLVALREEELGRPLSTEELAALYKEHGGPLTFALLSGDSEE